MKTSKKAAKKVQVVKAQAQVEAVNTEARQPVVPQASAFTAPKAVVQPWHKKSEDVQVVTVNQEKFNRSGFDALMLAGVGETAITQAVEVKKTVRARINDGFLGMTRRMYRKGCNGKEILEANRDARLAAGYNADKAMRRAKKDYGYIVREAKAEKQAKAAPVVNAVAVAV
jgi:hypothetical protein